MLSAILATTHSPLHSSLLVISDILAWKNVDSLFTNSLLLDLADVSWPVFLTELHLLRTWWLT